jgi:O-antigen/teichoic acid export membrane protein
VSTATRRLLLGGRTLREAAARGTAVNAAFLIGLSALGLVRGFVLAGLLTQSDYGVWGVIVVALGTVLLFRQVGIGDRYIQQDEPDQERAFQVAFTLEAAVLAVFTVIVAIAVPIAALAYGTPEIVVPGLVMLAVLPAGALQAPLWAHYRAMDYLRQRAIQALDPIVGFVVAVGLAIAGAGYWSFVVGVIAGVWATAIAAVATSPFRLRLRWERGALRRYASFSWPLLVASGAGVLTIQAAMLATTRELGLAAAGAVALAATISQFSDRVDQIVSGALYPAICAVQDRLDLLYESFVKANRLSLMWAVPFGLGVTLFAEDLVAFGIGERWRDAVPLLQAFGAIAAGAHLGFNWDGYFRARGDTRPMAVHGVVLMVVFLGAGLPLLLSEGLDGLAWGLAASAAAGLVCRAWYLRRLFPAFNMLAHAARAIAPAAPAVAAVLGARWLVGGDRSLARALAELTLYLAVAVAATWRLERPLLREAAGYVRGGVARRA